MIREIFSSYDQTDEVIAVRNTVAAERGYFIVHVNAEFESGDIVRWMDPRKETGHPFLVTKLIETASALDAAQQESKVKELLPEAVFRKSGTGLSYFRSEIISDAQRAS